MANTDKFDAGHALFHPSFLKPEDAKDLKSPVLVVPSKDEADLVCKEEESRVEREMINLYYQLPFMEILKQSNPGVSRKSEHHRFDDMDHGSSHPSFAFFFFFPSFSFFLFFLLSFVSLAL